MPELPEVEVLRRDLLSKMPKPARLVRIQLLAPKLRTLLKLPSSIKNKSIEMLDIRRRSKYLIFVTDQGLFLSHLGMSGRWRVSSELQKIKHDHVVLEWESGAFWVYNDPRRFGVFEYYKTLNQVKWLKDLGPEPLAPDFASAQVIAKIRNSNRAIKSIIMDAKVLVGVGNIYASESLYKAGIDPFNLGSKVSVKKLNALLVVVQETLQKAIDNGGSSIRDYVHSDGGQGNYQQHHLVYGRDGEPCAQCGNKIRIEKIQGRSTFWCNKCQS